MECKNYEDLTQNICKTEYLCIGSEVADINLTYKKRLLAQGKWATRVDWYGTTLSVKYEIN